MRSTSRSAWIRKTAWYGADVLRLVGTTQPRSGHNEQAKRERRVAGPMNFLELIEVRDSKTLDL